MRFLTCIIIGLVCFTGCVPEEDVDKTSQNTTIDSTQTPANTEGNTITVFLSGNTLSQLKPCGCAAEQLGGFSRRQVIFDKADAKTRLLVDTGNFLIHKTLQDMVKLNTIISSLITLGYDVVNFDENDLSAVSNGYSIKEMPFKVIGPAKELKSVFRRNISTAAVTVASVSSQTIEDGSLDRGGLEKLFSNDTVSAADLTVVNILIIDDFNESIANFLAGSAVVDVAVCQYPTDYPSIIKTDHKKPLFVSVGKLGKYVGKLDLILSDKKGLELSYSKVAVDKKLRPSEQLDEIYEVYRQMVQAEELLGKVIRTPLPDGHKYAGSDKCKDCHEYEHKMWSKMPHGHAYQTLVESGDAYDPECIECHVVGLKYESGFENENSPKGLRNVGCEVCHGPRAKHIKNAMDNTENQKKSEPIAAFKCISCHTPEHSPGFQADEAGYRKKNLHNKEQKAK
ncbi:MAG: hypothetical protein FVQ82_03595 [Planctomycetes bacterium]|nr:hypothetical protein [Planctomycetota bacterium]